MHTNLVDTLLSSQTSPDPLPADQGFRGWQEFQRGLHINYYIYEICPPLNTVFKEKQLLKLRR